MKKLTLLVLLAMPFANQLFSQGCVTIRNLNGFGQYLQGDNSFTNATWLVNVNTRYFTNSKDFKGSEDQHATEANENVNHSFTVDFMITRLLNKGWSISFGMPISANSRENSAEHGGLNTTRHTVHSFGVGDMRLEVYKWILTPSATQKFNFQLGLGIKLPTGDYEYKDWYYKDDTTKVLAIVNPSIQLGDGGTGLIGELNTYYIFGKTLSAYANFYYLSNPRDQNGTTPGWRTPSALAKKTGGDVLSVPDQYAIRGGADFAINKLIISAGMRYEGVPTHDLIGESNGVRRAGHNLSVEPGLTYRLKNASIYTYVPFMVDRQTKVIVPDIIAHEKYGAPAATPPTGGFADYLIFVGVLFKI